MQITLELPEDIAHGLESRWEDLPRVALESLALEAYRSHALTAAQLRRLLGFETRMQVDAFLKEHEIYDYSVTDFEQDRRTLRQLREEDHRKTVALNHPGCMPILSAPFRKSKPFADARGSVTEPRP
jgi:Uncharacterised protein family (UPF0175)